jgi:hypothetical protein
MLEHNLREAAFLAAQFAKEAGLPRGNLWEPPVTRHIAYDLERLPYREVENQWRQRLGLHIGGPSNA